MSLSICSVFPHERLASRLSSISICKVLLSLSDCCTILIILNECSTSQLPVLILKSYVTALEDWDRVFLIPSKSTLRNTCRLLDIGTWEYCGNSFSTLEVLISSTTSANIFYNWNWAIVIILTHQSNFYQNYLSLNCDTVKAAVVVLLESTMLVSTSRTVSLLLSNRWARWVCWLLVYIFYQVLHLVLYRNLSMSY